MPLTLISVHVPKAGGTSLAAGLRAHFGADLALDYDHDPMHPNSSREPPDLAPHIRAVHGRFPGDRYPGPAFRMTFVREPVSNLISISGFWERYPPSAGQLHQRFLAERPDLLAFAQYPGIQTLLSETYFGGVDLARFDFIGFYESRRRDLRRLSNLLAFELDPDLHLNQTSRDAVPLNCPACGYDERQDRKRLVADSRPRMVHRECHNGHAWHMPLVIRPETEPAPCDCDSAA